jgi:hypothetical protein
MTKTLLCTLLLLFASTCVHTYCIYNYTEDTSYFMRQEPLNTGGDYFA